MLLLLRDWLFPKVPMVPLERDSEGYYVGFGRCRRHKTLRMDDEEYRFRSHYRMQDPFNCVGRGSSAFPKPHFHMEQDELFKVIQGRMCYVCNGKEGVAHTGAVVELPKGAVHTFWCDPTSEEDVIVEFTARPGRGMDERNINSAYGIFNSYFVAQKPVPFLQDMVIWYEAASAPGHFPKPFAIMAAYMFGGVIGRLAGYRGIYPLYTEQEAGKE